MLHVSPFTTYSFQTQQTGQEKGGKGKTKGEAAELWRVARYRYHQGVQRCPVGPVTSVGVSTQHDVVVPLIVDVLTLFSVLADLQNSFA